MKNSTSSTGIIWMPGRRVAWIHCRYGGAPPGFSCAASCCSSCCMPVAPALPSPAAPLALRQALLDALDRDRQALALGRLEHVVGHALLEGLDRVLVVGGDEDDLAAASVVVVDRAQLRDLPRRLDAGQARHADVEEHEVGLVLVARAPPPRRRSSPRRRSRARARPRPAARATARASGARRRRSRHAGHVCACRCRDASIVAGQRRRSRSGARRAFMPLPVDARVGHGDRHHRAAGRGSRAR